MVRNPPYLVRNGIDYLLADPSQCAFLKAKRVGLLANQASLTSQFIPSAHALQEVLGSGLSCLFTPEHGWSAFCPAGKEIHNAKESYTRLPVYSLYGPLFEENLKILDSLDVLIIDLQDAGVRCYTYAATCAKIMEAVSLREHPIDFVVCDRPNPLGKRVQGPLLDLDFRSLVSYIDVPFQHGKSMGELLVIHNSTLSSPVSLSVILAESDFQPMTHVWIPPSLGLPDWESVLLYPGLVLLEGTNVSEGRGTSLPFKCVGAPGLDSFRLAEILNAFPESGVRARPLSYVPSTDKLSGQECQGVQLHVVDHAKIDGLRIGVAVLQALVQIYPFLEWKQHGGRYWIDSLTGSPQLRESL
jgi:uncharacterized protein YbbC (DUF1343 family)